MYEGEPPMPNYTGDEISCIIERDCVDGSCQFCSKSNQYTVLHIFLLLNSLILTCTWDWLSQFILLLYPCTTTKMTTQSEQLKHPQKLFNRSWQHSLSSICIHHPKSKLIMDMSKIYQLRQFRVMLIYQYVVYKILYILMNILNIDRSDKIFTI